MTSQLTLASAPVILPGHTLCRELCEPQVHAHLGSSCPGRSPWVVPTTSQPTMCLSPSCPAKVPLHRIPQDTPAKKALRSSGLHPLQFQLPSQDTLYMESPGSAPAHAYFSPSHPTRAAPARSAPGPQSHPATAPVKVTRHT